MGKKVADTGTAFNATLTIIALVLCSSPCVSGPEPPTSYEATTFSAQALKDTLAEALACLPLIDTGNKMVDKCAKFAATLHHCLHSLGKFQVVNCQVTSSSVYSRLAFEYNAIILETGN